MKKLYVIIAVLAVCAALPARGQGVAGIRNVEYTGEITPRGQQVDIRVTIDPSRLELGAQEMMVFTPVLVSAPDNEQVRFDPVVLAGGRRMKVIGRELRYGNQPFEGTPDIRRHRNGDTQPITLEYQLPYREWMRGADLVLMAEMSGCVDCDPMYEQQLLASIASPEFKVTYIIPETTQKTVSEKYAARLNYVVDKYDLLVNFKDNARVLAEVDGIIGQIVSNPDFRVTSCRVDGYASPEGRYERNVFLAENRAQAFLNYLRQNYNWDMSIVSSRGHGEDWQGLRDTVAGMTWLAERDQVLNIIDNTCDIAERKNKLKAVAGGSTYHTLLTNVYPPLRRNEFEITYEIRPYSVEEARVIFKSNPRLLSLSEMFLVAQSYAPGSREFQEVFDAAVRMFPDSDIAKVNAGAMEIEHGAQTLATTRLQNVDMPEAWNNLGVAYVLTGDYRRAAEYLGKAAEAGEINGRHNLEQLRMIYNE